MADGTIKRTDPIGVTVRAHTPVGTGGGSGITTPMKTYRQTVSSTSSADANFSWVNPEAGTVAASFIYIVTGSAGTGTIDAGRSDDGTGAANGHINGGTLTLGVHTRKTFHGTVDASGTIGVTDAEWVLCGPGGTGTNNSIVAGVTDGVDSTATIVGVVQYYTIE